MIPKPYDFVFRKNQYDSVVQVNKFSSSLRMFVTNLLDDAHRRNQN